MPELILRADGSATGDKPVVKVTPESVDWVYTGFEVYRLAAKEVVSLDTAGKETVVIVLEGTCDVDVSGVSFEHVGNRESVFDGKAPEAIYSPPGNFVTVRAESRAEVAVATAKAEEGVGGPRRITPDDIPYEERGEGSTRRYIHHILDEHHPANKLLLVEVVTPPGNWSSYPPHKHDEEIPGKEAYLEETYYYRINPPAGQALQRVYDKQGLETVQTPRDGDVVLVPRGYHPVASPPGFTTYYLNVMSGHHRVWKYTVDTDYAHLVPPDGNIMGRVSPSSNG